MSEERFWRLTPRQYHLLLERHRERQKHAEWLTGVVASAIANWSMGAPEEPLEPKHFALPLLHVPPKRKRLNRKQIAEDIRREFDREMKKDRKPACPKP